MPLIIDRRAVLLAAATLAISRPSIAEGTTHDIEMLNKHPEDKKKRMVFHPLIQSIEAGDTVRFLPTDKGHNSESIEGMIPDGVEPWKSKINKEISVTLEKPGVYGYLCLPHASLGMVGLIIVKGDGVAHNLEAAKSVKQRGRAKKIWDEIWAQVEADGLVS